MVKDIPDMPRPIDTESVPESTPSATRHDYFEATPRHSVALVWQETSAQVSLLGEIDLLAMRTLDGAAAILVAHRPVPISVDLAQVTFLGATGAAFLQGLARHADRGGHQVMLVAPDPSALRMLDICGVRNQVMIRPQTASPIVGEPGS